MRLALVPYKMSSQSCKKLQEELKRLRPRLPVVRLKKDSLATTARLTDIPVFWGNNESPASNKLRFFQEATRLEELNIPEFTTDINVAATWRNPNARKVSVAGFARTLLTAHSGRGIIPFNNGENTPLPEAPLYVRYVKKSEEYRVHILRTSY